MMRTPAVLGARGALQAGIFRVDASDFMPREIGGWLDEPPAQSAFYSGMNDCADGVRTIDQVLADIEADRADLQAQEGV